MSETLAELAETDALLTALSRGNVIRTGDPVYDALSGWVDEIMSHPVPRVEVELPAFYARETGSRAWRVAAAGIVVAAMSSSGIAAAATGDPLAPFNYVATALGHLAPDGPAETRNGGRILDGIERSRETQDSQVGAEAQSYGPAAAASAGRHRAPDAAPRHRAGDASADATPEATDTVYTPRHVAPEVVDPPSSPVETPPVETPPVETPVPETPPVTDPPPAEPEPQPVPGDGPDVTQPGPEEAPPADPAPTDSAPTGGEAADAAQVRVGEDAPVETPADQAAVE